MTAITLDGRKQLAFAGPGDQADGNVATMRDRARFHGHLQAWTLRSYRQKHDE